MTAESTSERPRKTLVSFSLASVALMGATMVSNLAVIRWLMPEQTGIWQTLVLAQSYFAFAQLGFFNGLNREYPFWMGRKEPEKARKMAGTAQLQAGICSVGSLVIFALALLFTDDPEWMKGIIAMGLVTGSGFYREYLAATYRTNAAFDDLARIFWVQAALLILTVPLVYWLRFDGLCLRLGLVALSVVFLMHRTRPVRVRAMWDMPSVKALLSAGAPLLALSYLITLSNGFDRVILLSHVGVVAVGLFAPALAIKNAMNALPAAVNQFISPRLSQRLGATSDAKSLWGTSWRATLATCGVMVPVVAVGWFALPPLIEAFFPRYVEAIYPAQLMLASGLFTGLGAGTAVLASLKAWVALGVLNSLTLGLLWVLPSYFAGQMEPLVGVAWGWLLARAILLPIGLGLIYGATHAKRNEVST